MVPGRRQDLLAQLGIGLGPGGDQRLARGFQASPVGEGQSLGLQFGRGGRGGEPAHAPDVGRERVAVVEAPEIGGQRRAAGLEGGEHLLEGAEVQGHGEAGVGPPDGTERIGFGRQGDGAPGVG